jgi:hypothetical protein
MTRGFFMRGCEDEWFNPPKASQTLTAAKSPAKGSAGLSQTELSAFPAISRLVKLSGWSRNSPNCQHMSGPGPVTPTDTNEAAKTFALVKA